MTARERLRARGLPTTIVPLAAAPAHEVRAAAAAVDEARRAYLAAEERGDDLTSYSRAETAAREALDACYLDATVTALSAERMEGLLSEHAATAEQADEGMQWNPDTFVAALLAEAVTFDEAERWSFEEWQDACTGSLALGEVTALFDAAYSLNGRGIDLRVGKESEQMPS